MSRDDRSEVGGVVLDAGAMGALSATWAGTMNDRPGVRALVKQDESATNEGFLRNQPVLDDVRLVELCAELMTTRAVMFFPTARAAGRSYPVAGGAVTSSP